MYLKDVRKLQFSMVDVTTIFLKIFCVLYKYLYVFKTLFSLKPRNNRNHVRISV